MKYHNDRVEGVKIILICIELNAYKLCLLFACRPNYLLTFTCTALTKTQALEGQMTIPVMPAMYL